MIVLHEIFPVGDVTDQGLAPNRREFVGPLIFVGNMWAFPVAYCEDNCKSRGLYPLLAVVDVSENTFIWADFSFGECPMTPEGESMRDEACRLYEAEIERFKQHPWPVQFESTLEGFHSAVVLFGQAQDGRAR